MFGSVEGGRDQPLGGGEGMGRLSRKATVEKGRVPAYVTQTQREMRVDSAKLTSTARNTMRQIPPPSSWVPSQIQGRFPRRRGSSLSQSAPSGPPSSASFRPSFFPYQAPATHRLVLGSARGKLAVQPNVFQCYQ